MNQDLPENGAIIFHQQQQHEQQHEQQQHQHHQQQQQQHPVIMDGVQEFEDALTPLQLHIENAEWEEVLDRIQSHPDEILPAQRGVGSVGRNLTALHLACESGECPLVIITSMLERHPEIAAMVDKDGNTPLHNACAGQFAYDPLVIAVLLACYPQAVFLQETVDQSTPLHLMLVLGGDVNVACLTMILDVAYGPLVRALAPDHVPLQQDFQRQPRAPSSVFLASQYPVSLHRVVQQMALLVPPNSFPAFLEPFILAAAISTLAQSPPGTSPAPHNDTFTTTTTTTQQQEKSGEDERRTPLLLMVESKGQTPLHSACARGASAHVVRILTNESRYPGAHAASRVRERKDRYPLFYAGCYGMPLDGIKLVFDVHPEAIQHVESYRLLCSQVAYLTPQYTSDVRKLVMKDPPRQSPTDPVDVCFANPAAVQMFQTVELLLRLTYHNSYADPPCWRVVHATAAIPSPPQIMRAAIHLHPWQIRERDENGDLPLHLVCRLDRRLTGGIDEFHYWLPEGVNQEKLHFRLIPEDRPKDNPVTLLLHAFPEGARCLDAKRCLPLHLAVCSGKEWMDGGVSSLVQAAPMALATRDGIHRLYPFQLAAMHNDDTLDVVYELLLANPTMVLCTDKRIPTRPPKRTKYT